MREASFTDFFPCGRAARVSLSIGVSLLLLAAQSYASMISQTECTYLKYFAEDRLVPSLAPSVSSKCVAAYNSGSKDAICSADCQSLYSAYSQCTSRTTADKFASAFCGQFNGTNCSSIPQDQYSASATSISNYCGNPTNCSRTCVSVIADVEQDYGCCAHVLVNGPKVLCGQKLIAPCSTVLSGGSVATPDKECAYIEHYLGPDMSQDPSLTPTLTPSCRRALSKGGLGPDVCIADCSSLYDLLDRCYGLPKYDYAQSQYCGKFGGQNCSVLLQTAKGQDLNQDLEMMCANSTYTNCPAACVKAISAFEQYAGCCAAYALNDAKVLCGQKPLPDCFSSMGGSGVGTIEFDLLLMTSAIVISLGIYF